MKNTETEIQFYHFLYTDIVNKMVHKKYAYVDTGGYIAMFVQELMNGDIRNTTQIYWKELLLRIHFAAVTSIIRNQKWLTGVIFGLESKNLMVFGSSLRGFLESAVDSHYSMEGLPTSLSLNFKNINAAVKGELNHQFLSKEIEDKLIHFQFAKKGKKGEQTQTALSNTEYINSFNFDDKSNVKELYSTLCEIAHPASDSLSCFTTEVKVTETYSYSTINLERDGEKISTLIVDYSDQIIQLMKMSLSLAVVCLKILQVFDCDEVHSEYIETCKFSEIMSKETWNIYLEMMEKGSKYSKVL